MSEIGRAVFFGGQCLRLLVLGNVDTWVIVFHPRHAWFPRNKKTTPLLGDTIRRPSCRWRANENPWSVFNSVELQTWNLVSSWKPWPRLDHKLPTGIHHLGASWTCIGSETNPMVFLVNLINTEKCMELKAMHLDILKVLLRLCSLPLLYLHSGTNGKTQVEPIKIRVFRKTVQIFGDIKHFWGFVFFNKPTVIS